MRNTRSKKSNRVRRRINKLKWMLVSMSLIIVSCFMFGTFLSNAQDPADCGKTKYYKSIQIESGDSLWTIAEENMSEEYESIYEYIGEIASINHITNERLDHLQEGDYLMIAYYE